MTLDDEIDRFAQEFLQSINEIDFSPTFPEIEQIILNSIDRNFREGGRYGNGPYGGGSNKWDLPKRVRDERRQAADNGHVLVDTGQLAKSIRVNIIQEGNTITIEVGSNKVYARIHQLGGTINHPGGTPYVIEWNNDLNKPWAKFISKKRAARIESSKGSKLKGKVKYTQAHKISIEARPYLVLQEEDVEAIRQVVLRYIIKVLGR